MSQFILFMRGGSDFYENLSPEEIQQQIQKYRDWAHALQESGKLVDAFKLHDGSGRILSANADHMVVDGPFAETKETIGGYYVIRAADYDEAVQIAKQAPIYVEGGSVEVRQIEM